MCTRVCVRLVSGYCTALRDGLSGISPGPLRRSDAVDERHPRRPGEDGGGGTREVPSPRLEVFIYLGVTLFYLLKIIIKRSMLWMKRYFRDENLYLLFDVLLSTILTFTLKSSLLDPLS